MKLPYNLRFLSVGKSFVKAYTLFVILFFIWLYRVDYIVSDSGGLAKALQVGTIFGMLYIVFSRNNNILRDTFTKTNIPVKTLIIFYSLALISTAWSFVPTFAFFLSFQNIVIILSLVFIFSRVDNFKTIEKLFLSIAVAIIFFEIVFDRILYTPALFIHSLSSASSAAICFSYSIVELMTMKKEDKERKSYFKFIIVFSVFVLVTNTSSGANASAIFGLCTALFFSGHFIYVFFILFAALFLYINKHLIDDIIFFIMPGKTIETIESATGRTELWETMMELANKKPLLGWGFGCIERAATAYGDKPSPDAHNNYLGVYGSLGYIGLIIFVYHFIVSMLYSLKRKARPGFLGLFSGTCCAALNGYSYGFLSGKACSITVVYFAIIILMYSYSRIRLYDKYRYRNKY